MRGELTKADAPVECASSGRRRIGRKDERNGDMVVKVSKNL